MVHVVRSRVGIGSARGTGVLGPDKEATAELFVVLGTRQPRVKVTARDGLQLREDRRRDDNRHLPGKACGFATPALGPLVGKVTCRVALPIAATYSSYTSVRTVSCEVSVTVVSGVASSVASALDYGHHGPCSGSCKGSPLAFCLGRYAVFGVATARGTGCTRKVLVKGGRSPAVAATTHEHDPLGTGCRTDGDEPEVVSRTLTVDRWGSHRNPATKQL